MAKGAVGLGEIGKSETISVIDRQTAANS